MSLFPKSATNCSISATFCAASDVALISASALSSGVPAMIGTFFPILRLSWMREECAQDQSGETHAPHDRLRTQKDWLHLSPGARVEAIETIDDSRVSMEDARPRKIAAEETQKKKKKKTKKKNNNKKNKNKHTTH